MPRLRQTRGLPFLGAAVLKNRFLSCIYTVRRTRAHLTKKRRNVIAVPIIFSGFPGVEETYSCREAPAVVSAWSKLNRCNSKAQTTFNEGNVMCRTFKECQSPVSLCSVNGGGHTWPGGNYSPVFCQSSPDGHLCDLWKQDVGPLDHSVQVNNMIWRFFDQFNVNGMRFGPNDPAQ